MTYDLKFTLLWMADQNEGFVSQAWEIVLDEEIVVFSP